MKPLDKEFKPGDCVVSIHSNNPMKVKMYDNHSKRESIIKEDDIANPPRQVVICTWKDRQGKEQSREFEEKELKLCDEETQNRM
jgi:hypothetical protein